MVWSEVDLISFYQIFKISGFVCFEYMRNYIKVIHYHITTNKRVREIIRPNSEIRTDFPENLVLMTVENSTQNCITAHPIVYFRLYGTYDQMS